MSQRLGHGHTVWYRDGASAPRFNHEVACHAKGAPALSLEVALARVRLQTGEVITRDAELSRSPFGAVRPKASLCRCESWRWPSCASGFMTATVRRKQFPLRWAHSSRGKLFAPSGSSLRCDRKRCSQPVPRRSDHNKDAMGANLV